MTDLEKLAIRLFISRYPVLSAIIIIIIIALIAFAMIFIVRKICQYQAKLTATEIKTNNAALAKQIAAEIKKNGGTLAKQIAYELNKTKEEKQDKQDPTAT